MSYLAHLYPHHRIHQVFGANTDVGKTIFTTALALASASLPFHATSLNVAARDERDYPIQHQDGEKVYYIKPVSTGSLQDADNR
jgi:dethiobiotin synthetase/adenosylmethionine--8-amino-7-oxononanoate aminotransferase